MHRNTKIANTAAKRIANMLVSLPHRAGRTPSAVLPFEPRPRISRQTRPRMNQCDALLDAVVPGMNKSSSKAHPLFILK